jgi:hypothetical protein
MEDVTLEHRKKELRILLDKVSTHPSQDLSAERERIVVLQAMIDGANRVPHDTHA